jgi:hypothetical protein
MTMDSNHKTSTWLLIFDTIFLFLAGIDLGFFTMLYFLMSIPSQTGLAGPILALYYFFVWPFSALIYFVILRLLKKFIFVSNTARYIFYSISFMVPLVTIAYIYFIYIHHN